jgi:hypothetical protein
MKFTFHKILRLTKFEECTSAVQISSYLFLEFLESADAYVDFRRLHLRLYQHRYSSSRVICRRKTQSMKTLNFPRIEFPQLRVIAYSWKKLALFLSNAPIIVQPPCKILFFQFSSLFFSPYSSTKSTQLHALFLGWETRDKIEKRSLLRPRDEQ